jgi:hypothetical protein
MIVRKPPVLDTNPHYPKMLYHAERTQALTVKTAEQHHTAKAEGWSDTPVEKLDPLAVAKAEIEKLKAENETLRKAMALMGVGLPKTLAEGKKAKADKAE